MIEGRQSTDIFWYFCFKTRYERPRGCKKFHERNQTFFEYHTGCRHCSSQTNYEDVIYSSFVSKVLSFVLLLYFFVCMPHIFCICWWVFATDDRARYIRCTKKTTEWQTSVKQLKKTYGMKSTCSCLFLFCFCMHREFKCIFLCTKWKVKCFSRTKSGAGHNITHTNEGMHWKKRE